MQKNNEDKKYQENLSFILTSTLGMIYLSYQVYLARKAEYPMNKEEILARSRNENKGMDIIELQSLEKASRIAAQVDVYKRQS